MSKSIRGLTLAVIFALVGAFSASLWLEIQRETPAAAASDAHGEWEGRPIRVEVLNGAGVQGIAHRATERLRERGFDVVHYGNVEGFGYDSSQVIARIESVEPARRVADALGIRRVRREPDRNLYLDVSVVLGLDWAETEGEGPGAAREGAASWWRRLTRAARRLWPG